jgi:hypothetical protein
MKSRKPRIPNFCLWVFSDVRTYVYHEARFGAVTTQVVLPYIADAGSEQLELGQGFCINWYLKKENNAGRIA